MGCGKEKIRIWREWVQGAEGDRPRENARFWLLFLFHFFLLLVGVFGRER